MFDIDQLMNSPIDFVDYLSNTNAEESDLGVYKNILNIYNENNQIFDDIPILLTKKDIQTTEINTLVRIKCFVTERLPLEYFPYKFPVNDVFKSCLMGQNIEFLNDKASEINKYLRERHVYHARTPYPLSNWVTKDHSYSTSFILKFAYNPPLQPYEILDVIGIITDSVDDTFFEMNTKQTTFIALFHLKGTSLYKDISMFNMFIADARNLVLSVFVSLFCDESIGKILLFWLVSKVSHTKYDKAFGTFTLNLYNVSSDDSKALSAILNEFCTSFKCIDCAIDILNQDPFHSNDFDSHESHPIMIMNSTRIMINETNLKTGKFDEKGTRNVLILKKLVEEGKIQLINGVNQYISSLCQILVVSSKKSLFSVDVSIQVNKTNITTPQLTDEHISIIRAYIENIRNFSLSDEEDSIQHLEDLIIDSKNSLKLSQDSISLLYLFARLNSISYGSQIVTEEIWFEAREAFKAKCLDSSMS